MLIKFVLLSHFSIGLTACDPEAPKFPNLKVWETTRNPENGELLCGEYKIKDPEQLTFEPVVDHPIDECVGSFGLKGPDFPAVIDWIAATKKYYMDKLNE